MVCLRVTWLIYLEGKEIMYQNTINRITSLKTISKPRLYHQKYQKEAGCWYWFNLPFREAKLDGYSRFFSNLDEAVKLLQNTCIDQTKKHQTAFKREYNKISHSFSKLSRAFDTDPSNCEWLRSTVLLLSPNLNVLYPRFTFLWIIFM